MARHGKSRLKGRFALGGFRVAAAVAVFASLTLPGSVSFAEDEPADAPKPADASKPAASGEAAPEGAAKYEGCTDPKDHPNQDPTVCKLEKEGIPCLL